MKHRTKIIIAILIFLLLIIGGVVFYYHSKLPAQITSILKQELLQQLNTNDRDIYIVDIEEITISLTSPQLRIPRISIQLKDQVFTDTLPEELPANLISLTIKDVGISADGIIAALRNRKDIIFSRAELSVTDFTLFSNPKSIDKRENTDTIPMEGNYGISQLELLINNFTYKPLADTTTTTFTTEHLHFSGGVKKGIFEKKEPGWFIEKYILSLVSVNYYPEEELYSYHIEKLDASSDEGILSLLSTAIKPKYGKKEFQQHLKYQIDRMDVTIDTIILKDFNPNVLINENSMKLSGMSIINAHVGVYRDRNLPQDTLRRPVMPTRLMHSSPVLFYIPEIELHNVDVIYAELPENGTTEGVVPITSIDATIRNFTNMADSLQKDSMMQIVAGGRFFQQARLKATFDYNLQDLNGGYRARGELSKLDFKKINDVVKPLLKIEVEDGVHVKTNFAFSGNDTRSTGTITMLYNDLSLVLEPDRSRIRRAVVGWAGRNLVYYPSNPVNNGEIREGTIEFERDITRFVFHYWWNCYLSGIKSTVLRDNINIGSLSN